MLGGAAGATLFSACQAPPVSQNPVSAGTSAPAGTAASGTPGTEPQATGQANAGGEATTLRVWGYGLDDARAKARIASFNQANSQITIEAVGGALNTQQLLTAVASGDPPEVVSVDRSQTGSWAGRNAIDPIDDLISRDQFDLKQFYPFLVNQVTYKGAVYGIPQFVNIDLIYMNLDAFKEAGVDPNSVNTGDWESLQTLGEKLHKMDGDKVVRTGFDTKTQDGRLWLWSWANGAEPISSDGTKANFADPKVVEALTWAKETVDKQGGEKARAAFSQTQNFFSAQNPVLIGQIAMTVFEQWLIGVMKVNPQANFKAVLPRMRNGTQELTDATGSAFAIPKGIQGAKRDAAWSFIKGMTSAEAWIAGEKATATQNKNDGQPYHPTITGNQQADTEAWTNIYTGISPAYDEAVKLFPQALQVAKYRYAGPVAAQIADLTTAAVNDALQGVRSPEEAMIDLQTQAQQAIDDFANGPGNR